MHDDDDDGRRSIRTMSDLDVSGISSVDGDDDIDDDREDYFCGGGGGGHWWE